jgi:hypothetical protein
MGYTKMGETVLGGEHLDLAVNYLQQANRIDRLPVALIERARLRRDEWRQSASETARRLCESDLEEASQEISFSRMSLLGVDYQILRAEVLADSGEGAAALDLVRDVISPDIEAIGYDLRAPAVSELTKRLQGV